MTITHLLNNASDDEDNNEEQVYEQQYETPLPTRRVSDGYNPNAQYEQSFLPLERHSMPHNGYKQEPEHYHQVTPPQWSYNDNRMHNEQAHSPPRLPPFSMLTEASCMIQQSEAMRNNAQPVQSIDHHLLCRYRNKECRNPRAFKRNGERHNLCERHREKANANQRKLESKRRKLKHTSSPTSERHVTPSVRLIDRRRFLESETPLIK